MDVLQKTLKIMEKRQPSLTKRTLKEKLFGGKQFKGREVEAGISVVPEPEKIGWDKPFGEFLGDLNDLEYKMERDPEFLSNGHVKYLGNAANIMKNLTPEQIVKLKISQVLSGRKTRIRTDDLTGLRDAAILNLTNRFIDAFYGFRKKKYLSKKWRIKEETSPMPRRYDIPMERKELKSLSPKIRKLYKELYSELKNLSYPHADRVEELESRVLCYIEKTYDPTLVGFILNEIKESKEYEQAVKNKKEEIFNRSKHSQLRSHIKEEGINGIIDEAIVKIMKGKLKKFKSDYLRRDSPPLFSSDSSVRSRLGGILDYGPRDFSPSRYVLSTRY